MGIGIMVRKRKLASTGKQLKTAKQMERHLKGIANHRRIDVILLVAKEPGITVEGIAENLDCNYNTLSIHIAKLKQAGLLDKKYKGRNVGHTLTPYGGIFVTFLKSFQHL
ncbi:MAG TPA: winged helix-turn-helix domain-containing protein [Candidatus Paceibacterota bacterium]